MRRIPGVIFRIVIMLATVLSPAVVRGETYTVNVATGLTLLASPFAGSSGQSIAFSNLMFATTGTLNVYLWRTTNVMWHYGTINRTGTWVNQYGTSKVARGEGFFIDNKSGVPADLVFSGALSTAMAITNVYIGTNQLGQNAAPHLVGYPYLSSIGLNAMNLNTGIVPYVTGTTIYVWAPEISGYRMFFYDADGSLGGGWQDADDPGQPTDYTLAPMQGFWLWIRGQPSLTWKALPPP